MALNFRAFEENTLNFSAFETPKPPGLLKTVGSSLLSNIGAPTPSNVWGGAKIVGSAILDSARKDAQARQGETLGQSAMTSLVKRPAKYLTFLPRVIAGGMVEAGKTIQEFILTYGAAALGKDLGKASLFAQGELAKNSDKALEKKLFFSETDSFAAYTERLQNYLATNPLATDAEKKTLPIVLPMMMLSAELMPWGKPVKKGLSDMVKRLAVDATEEAALKTLRSAGVPEEAATRMARFIPGANNEKAVREVIGVEAQRYAKETAERAMREAAQQTAQDTASVGARVTDTDLLTEARKYKSAEEFVRAKQPEKVPVVSATQRADYMGGHEAPMGDSGAPIWDLSGKYTDIGIYPDDFYTRGDLYKAGETYDSQAIAILQSLRDRPNATVKVYRAVSKDVKNPKLNVGDWVTTTREYAKDHGESNLGGNYKIISQNVRARDIFTDGNSIHEFGYDPQPVVRPKDMPYEILQRTADKPNTTTGIYKSQLTDIWKEANAVDDLPQILRGTKGMTAEDITKTYPNIKLTKDVSATDVSGKKVIIPEGEKLTPYELKGNKILLQDGETYIVSKNQFQNIKGNSTVAEGKPFAPELEGVEETVKREGQFALDASHEAQVKPRYSSYTLPGGENYKEILVRAPVQKASPDEAAKAIFNLKYDELFPNQKKDVDAFIAQGKQYNDKSFKSSHWPDEVNPIFHIRMNERTYKGKKVAFMEELQSDWAREGRDKGFATTKEEVIEKAVQGGMTEKQAITDINKLWSNPTDSPSNPTMAEWKRVGNALEKVGVDPNIIHDHARGVPKNPLLKNWQELSVKRALKEAVASDAEYFAWINGEQTSARYNLATHVQKVNWFDPSTAKTGGKSIVLEPKSGGKRLEFEIGKDGVITTVEDGVPLDWKGKKLDEVLGKGLADKIMEKESGTLSGEGLKFGGEWAENLYDKQVGNIVKNLTGAKVEVLDMGLPIEGKKAFQWESPIGERNGWINMSEPEVFARRAKVGMPIRKDGGEMYIITDILGDGKFKAVPRNLGIRSSVAKDQHGTRWESLYTKSGEYVYPNSSKETFDISQKTTTQQAVRLTPEIKAKIRGEAPEIKTSGKKFTDTETARSTKSLETQQDKIILKGGTKPPTKYELTGKQLREVEAALRRPDVSDETADMLRAQVSMIEETIEDHPGRQLVKYVSRETSELPEVARGKTSKFGRDGDKIVQSVMGVDATLDDADAAIKQYRSLKARLDAARSDVRVIRAESRMKKQGEYLIRRAVGDRRAKLRAVQARFNLTDSELAEIRRGRDISIMKQEEFAEFMAEAEGRAAQIVERSEALVAVKGTMFEKEFTKVDNLREAMNLPPMTQMNAEQLWKFNSVLEQFKQGDEFLSVRKLETVDNTDLKGIKTVREAKERLITDVNVVREANGQKPYTLEELSKISVAELDRYRYDNALARRNPFYQYMVEEKTKAFLNANVRTLEIRDRVEDLIKAARASRSRGAKERLIPTDKRLFEWLEADDAKKIELSKDMTREELEAGHYIRNLYAEARDYLVQHGVLKKYRADYITHIRRGFLEAWSEDGLTAAFKEAFNQYKLDEAMFNILDQKTGDVLPLEKFFRFSMTRSGELKPTMNVARAVETYFGSLEKKKALDSLVPKLDIYTYALAPKKMTPRGLEFDASLKRFINEWVNTKKGRPLSMIVKPGGKLDWAVRSGVAFTRLIDLGFSIPIGIATSFGEQTANFIGMGTKNYSKGIARLLTPKGRAISQQYEAFVGDPLIASFTRASQDIGDKLVNSAFALFQVGTRKANQVFLLGSMSPDEWAKGVISPERLARLQQRMAKYRVTPDAESIFGKTAEGTVARQYKSWAVPLFSGTMRNIAQFTRAVKNRGFQDALQKEESIELLRSIVLMSAIGFGAYGLLKGDKKPSEMTFAEEIAFKSARDAISLLGALEPSLFTSEPRLLQFVSDIGEATSQIVKMEENADGELRGLKSLERAVTPAPIRQMTRDTSSSGGVGGLQFNFGGSGMQNIKGLDFKFR